MYNTRSLIWSTLAGMPADQTCFYSRHFSLSLCVTFPKSRVHCTEGPPVRPALTRRPRLHNGKLGEDQADNLGTKMGAFIGSKRGCDICILNYLHSGKTSGVVRNAGIGFERELVFYSALLSSQHQHSSSHLWLVMTRSCTLL